MTVKIFEVEVGGKPKLRVESPYHPDFPRYAGLLGGAWNGKVWHFDPRDEASVRDLCRDYFGTDGETEPALVDVRVRLSGPQGREVRFAGRKVASRFGRDSRVKLGEGVVVVEGEFADRGGSSKHPLTMNAGESVLLEVRDVPLPLALREAKDAPDRVTVLSELPSGPEMPATVELLPDAAAHLAALREFWPSKTDAEIMAYALAACREQACG